MKRSKSQEFLFTGKRLINFTITGGEENVILNLYDKICMDNRNSLSRIIYQENILERGFKSIDELDTSGIKK